MLRSDHVRAVAVLAALSLAIGGCLISSSEDTKYQGRYVSPETLDRVKEGSDQKFVTDLLGEPTSRSVQEEGVEIWKWEYTKATTKKGAVFILLASSTRTTQSEAIFVKFRDGRVTKTWRSAI